MSLTAAQHDEVGAPLACSAHDFGLHVAGFDVAGGVRHSKLGRHGAQALRGTIEQLIFDLHRGHDRLAHGLDGNEFHHVQELHFRTDRDTTVEELEKALKAAPGLEYRPADGSERHPMPLKYGNPYDLWPDQDDNIWIENAVYNSLVKFEPKTKKFTYFPFPVLRAHTPKLDRDKEGTFWFTLGRPSTLTGFKPRGNVAPKGGATQ